jgi:putative endonuclease
MPYFVYILKSEIDGTYYKGSCIDFLKRLEEHNSGNSRYTSTKRPWKLIYVEEFIDKTKALKRERKLKKCKADYFEWLAQQSSNILNR